MSLKKIKIFLASSSELEEDRRELEIAIKRKNDQLIKSNIYVELIVWEDFIDVVSESRLQNEYNKSILECDIFVLLFFTKVGKFTFEEFTVAHKQFLSKGYPKIITYFKNAPILSGSLNQVDANSLFQFKEKLKEIGHYETRYDTVGELKYHLIEQLTKLGIHEKHVQSKPVQKFTEVTAKRTSSKKYLAFGLGIITLCLIAFASYKFIGNTNDTPLVIYEDTLKGLNAKNDSILEVVESEITTYDAYVTKALLKLDMAQYDEAQRLLELAKKEQNDVDKANIVLTWIDYIKNYDKLYATFPKNPDSAKLYARCIIPEEFEMAKDSNGIETKLIIKEKRVTNWREVICDGTHAKKLNEETIRTLQDRLKEKGYYFGEINGKMTKFLWASMIFFYNGSGCMSAAPGDCGFYPEEYIAGDVMKALGIQVKTNI